MALPTYNLTKGEGVIADGAHVPNDPSNRDRQQISTLTIEELYAPGAKIELPIADAIDAAIATVDALADLERKRHIPPGETSQTWFVLRYLEAQECLADGTPTAPEYPLLAAQIPSLGADVSLVATAVVALTDAMIGLWKPIEEERAATNFALASCTTQAQIDALIAAIEWPA